jgi:hypothetical protein
MERDSCASDTTEVQKVEGDGDLKIKMILLGRLESVRFNDYSHSLLLYEGTLKEQEKQDRQKEWEYL